MKYVFGVDIGGTTVKLGFFDEKRNVLDKLEIPTRKELRGKFILPDIAESITDKLMEKEITKDQVVGVGVGVPGPVDADGVVFKAVNLGWDIFSVSNTLSELINLPVKAGNDANVAALGEMWKGGGKGHDDLVAVTLGTGVGGGIIVHGKLLAGATGAGGEIGHIHVEDNETDRCGCGKQGCLEQYGSATGLVRLAKRNLEATEKASILREGEITAKAICDAAREKDEVAVKTLEQFGAYLGKGLAAIACVVNPEIFVIGGGVSKAGEMLFDYIRPHFEREVFHACKGAKFALATLGNDAGIYGAARLALEQD
mgnify:CR=1 FL=1